MLLLLWLEKFRASDPTSRNPSPFVFVSISICFGRFRVMCVGLSPTLPLFYFCVLL